MKRSSFSFNLTRKNQKEKSTQKHPVSGTKNTSSLFFANLCAFASLRECFCFFCLLAAILLLFACVNKNEEKSFAANGRYEVQPVNVRIQEVKPMPFENVIQVSGIVKAYEDVNLSPEEGGVVKEWKAQKGQFVKKGEIIALLKMT
jgi:multidrug efflux pump subunit AcrA (membrane-fusion protein)